MTSIRMEILDAQTEFEEHSNIVTKVLSGIQNLYFYHRVREAAHYQMKFNELFEQEDYFGLQALSADIQSSIGKAKKSADHD
jgi:putative GTP pyrophosphokinase